MSDKMKNSCPFTHVAKDFGHSVWLAKDMNDLWFVGCNCGYRGPIMATPEQAIRSHNELVDLRNRQPTEIDRIAALKIYQNTKSDGYLIPAEIDGFRNGWKARGEKS